MTKSSLLMIGIILALSISFFGQGRRDTIRDRPPDVSTEIERLPTGPVLEKHPAPVITGKDYDQMKSDASELAALSRKISDQLNTNANAWLVVSVQTVKDAEQVEKLAKKLRSELKTK